MNKNNKIEYSTIQKIIHPLDYYVIDQYFITQYGYAELKNNEIALSKKTKLSFNTYLNSFYHSTWTKLTEFKKLFIEFEFTGLIRLEIYSENQYGTTEKILTKKLESDNDTTEILEIQTNRYQGENESIKRIFFEIKSLKKSSVKSIKYKTDAQENAGSKNTLNFINNDNAQVKNILEKILPDHDLFNHIEAINFFTNQIDPTQEIIFTEKEKIRIIDITKEKNNFNSLLYNYLEKQCEESNKTNHFIFKNILKINWDILLNCCYLLSYTNKELVIDGSVADINHPWMLHIFTCPDINASNNSINHQIIDLRQSNILPDQTLQCYNSGSSPWRLRIIPEKLLAASLLNTSELFCKKGGTKGTPPGSFCMDALFLPGFTAWGSITEYLVHNPLQEIILPTEKIVSDLFIRELAGHIEFGQHYLTMPPGSKLSFNTYFNSFYESYWSECSNIENVALLVEFSGKAFIEIFRDTKHQGVSKIYSKHYTAHGFVKVICPIPLASPSHLAEPGRLFVDILADGKTQIRRLIFQTTKAPDPDLQITLGICTYNRESFLHRNLQAIEAFGHSLPDLRKIFVINQGKPFQNTELAKLIEDSKLIQLVEQRNLGGCGGFTRSMQEALTDPHITHHILMDDDVVIDPRILLNLCRFLGYSKRNIIVGSPMLDLLRPWVLY